MGKETAESFGHDLQDCDWLDRVHGANRLNPIAPSANSQLVSTTIRAEASISIVVAEAFEALVAPQFPPLVLLVMAQRAGIAVQVTLSLLMPPERLLSRH
jgi:hypothetical protein